MNEPTPVTTDLLLMTIIERLETALTGDPDALPDAAQSFQTLVAALTAGAPLPSAWAAAVAPDIDSATIIGREDDGTYTVTSPGMVVEVATFDAEDGQSGLDFFAGTPQVSTSQTVRFPKPPNAPRWTARSSSPATVTVADLPLDAPSLLTAAPPVSVTSHKATKETRKETATRARGELLWMVVDAAAKGLCVFEATAMMQRRHPNSDMHHGKNSGNMNWLMKHGYVEESGQTRTTPSNKQAIAWVPTSRTQERILFGYEVRAYPLAA